ncbi:hypothetical protein [Limnobaculum xujianqingii]|uniref:hypothetical protein n=1 Tax=Limnobaculum xujianqingii TaxID=2738837 RepID=UPI001E3FCE05|nr:hypothetical protein [Limnobaculum xujianqingii]
MNALIDVKNIGPLIITIKLDRIKDINIFLSFIFIKEENITRIVIIIELKMRNINPNQPENKMLNMNPESEP